MRRKIKGYWFGFSSIVFFLFAQVSGYSQEIKVSGGFVKDSIQIGEPIGYYLAVAYPQALTVLFPDSTYNFAPFEFNRKIFSPTFTSNGISHDSVVYYISTFEIDSVQSLNLPVFVTSARDCTAYNALPDSVFLIEAVNIPLDSLEAQKLPLKTNTIYERVFSQFNYIILLIAGGVLLVLAIAGWGMFGQKIIQYFKIRELKKKYNKFASEFNAQVNQLREKFSPELAEQTVLTWKKYMEGISKIPYTKFTTPEINETFVGNSIGPSLASIDRMTYGGIKPDSLDSFQQLKSEAENSFQKKITQTDESPVIGQKPFDRSGNSTMVSQPYGKAPVQYTLADIQNYADIMRHLPCPICHRSTQPLNGTIAYTVMSFLVITHSSKKSIIACPDCLNKKNNLAIVISSGLGWWGFPWGLIKTPQYIYENVRAKKHNKRNQPNDILLSLALIHAHEIEVNKNNPEKLKDIITKV